MSEMSTNYTFINEKFIINTDVYFTVDTTVINGHRICKLKSLKIYYHGDSFEMIVGSVVYKYIIQDGIRSIPSIELINYLNKLINHENLFDVYSDEFDSNLSMRPSTHREIQQEISSFIIHDKSNEYNSNRYKKGLISESHFIKSELVKLRNQNYPICYSKYNEIKNIPVFCYIHPSLAINQGSTIILCHIGYILEKLANYKRFPEFNTQAVISFLNIVSESARTDKSVEKINNLNLELENEKLQKKYLKKKEKCKCLEKRMEDMEELMKSVNQSNIDLKQEIHNQRTEISGLNNKIDTQSKKIDNQTSEIVNLQVKLDDKSTQLETTLTNLIEVTNKAQEFKQKSDNLAIIKLSGNRISTGLTDEIFILLFRKDLNDSFHRKFPTESLDVIALDTISCQKENRAKLLKEHKFDEKTCLIIYETNKGNSLDFNRFVKNNAEIIQPIRNSKENPKLIRKFKIHKSNLDYLKSELKKISNNSESIRDEIIKNNQSLIENISNPLENVYNSVKDSDITQANEIKELLMKINLKLDDHKQEIINEISQNKEEIISSLDENLKSIYDQQVVEDDLKIISENELSILVYRRYREIIPSKGVYEYYTEIKNHKPINKKILTVKDLLFGRFRDKDGTIYLPNSDRRSKIAEKYLRQ